ncbi:hypothetical protein FJQ98_24945 [Lysinibacillus agricola]|uniref:CBM6 domain-containing protein n=1 Tax=Lysinibacillus agricola TaxID=2590012 RepID=A0ABX7AQR9_9BACI|nr:MULTISPECIES: hypothetical protein [Lysinibacillus]KOS63138.1 hypothetical protein AN161_07875 [Lysinibacillus sp. FJAT-14222]QQP12301.1 hypothetical protein FJQ98_24945 [Lysinibacillus agricola]
MKLNKVLSLMIVGAILGIGGVSVYANADTDAVQGDAIESNADAIEPDAVQSDAIENIQVRSQNLVISDVNISQSNGTYERTWSQPKGWKYYRFYVKNATGTKVKVQIQQNGYTQDYNLSANASNVWTQSAAVAGDHKIIVSTSDGRKFKGDVSVRLADAPF